MKGYTLVEILVVVVIVAILAMITIPELKTAHQQIESQQPIQTIYGMSEIELNSHDGDSARLGVVTVGGYKCVYLLGYYKGGISCDFGNQVINAQLQ